MFNYTSEWDPDSPGPQVVVELRESPSDSNHSSFNGTALAVDGPKLIVRAEEVLIVGFVFCIWIAAIALFFNRWGKIRMLEPYQPKFQQQHRSSCPLVDISSMSPSQRLSLPRVSITTACPKHSKCPARASLKVQLLLHSSQSSQISTSNVSTATKFGVRGATDHHAETAKENTLRCRHTLINLRWNWRAGVKVEAASCNKYSLPYVLETPPIWAVICWYSSTKTFIFTRTRTCNVKL